MAYILRGTDDANSVFVLKASGSTSFGRDDSNDYQLSLKSVSKNHASIQVFGANKATITDLGSRNGTYIGTGNPITWRRLGESQSTSIYIGDLIRFGNSGSHFKFEFDENSSHVSEDLIRLQDNKVNITDEYSGPISINQVFIFRKKETFHS
jgi:pSer/pThr/pTyr-binding forkhead associated (FHA) protein